MIEKLLEHCDLDWVMIAACFTVYQHEQELIDFLQQLHERGIAVINSAVFHGGFLTGNEFFNYRVVSRESAEDNHLFEWREKFFELCAQFGATPAEAAVSFGVSPPGVVSIALNNSQPKYVKINARVATTVLPNEFWIAMKKEGLVRADYPYLGIN